MKYLVTFESLTSTTIEVETNQNDTEGAVNKALELYNNNEGAKTSYGPSVVSIEAVS